MSLRREAVDARFPGLLGAVLAAAEQERGEARGTAAEPAGALSAVPS